MGDPKGFLKVKRQNIRYRPISERVKDFREVALPLTDRHSREQASRCMDCGIPFCQWGCPVNSYIPEWNDLMFAGQWQKAFELLNATNNLPEITGRVCPAICEYACVLSINDDPVTIRENELAIIEYAFNQGLVKPKPPNIRTGKKIAIIGSGPAGISCAAQLNKAGHNIVVFEKDDKAGGILRYGIPDFKLKKRIIDRRLEILKKEGIKFETGVNVGLDLKVVKLQKEFDALCLTGGSRIPRDLRIEGRDLKGIHFAMDFLIQANRKAAGEIIPVDKFISAKNKRVVVIGGGDTGADCVGTLHRQGANCVVQIELLPKPPERRTEDYPWPQYPLLLKTSTSHEEGGKRYWSTLTEKFIGEDGQIKKISCLKVKFSKDKKGCPVIEKIPGSEFEINADLVILAIGFVHPEHQGLLAELGVELDRQGNVKTNEEYMTSKKGIFCAGDMRRGQSLVAWAIFEGRLTAHYIDKYLMGESCLPFCNV